MRQSNTEKFEKAIMAHIDDKMAVSHRLNEMMGDKNLTEVQRINLAECIARLTRTHKEMW